MIEESNKIVLMRVLSNLNRYKILKLIYSSNRDLCVNEISQTVQISQSLASHQLAYLTSKGLVKAHRMGQIICYLKENNALSEKLLKVLNILAE
jgi:ArsR family transcriptional regulator